MTTTDATPAQPADDLRTLVQTVVSQMAVYRSSIARSDPLSDELDAALDWVRTHRPDVQVEVLTDPTVSDPVLLFRIDDRLLTGPLFEPKMPRWLTPAFTTDQFEQFFTDQRVALTAHDDVVPYIAVRPQPDGTTLINDWSRLNETAVAEVVGPGQQRWPFTAYPPTEADLCNVVADAVSKGRQITMAGRRHSQGGHTFRAGATVIDITCFNQILEFDPTARTIRVQAGTTWDQIQQHVQPHRLAVKVMQAYPFFTVGGALSVGIHESDLRFALLIDTVVSFRLLLADGRIIEVNRTENPELMGFVIGGFGLFGFILDVVLELTDDDMLVETTALMDPAAFVEQFATFLQDGTVFGYARPCFARDDPDFMQELSVVTYREAAAPSDEAGFALAPYSYLGLRKLLYDMSRRYEWAKQWRWTVQTQVGDNFNVSSISRNNIMRADIRIPGDHRSATDTDSLQEYFVPCTRFAAFITDLRTILLDRNVNVMSCGIRYVPRSNGSVMSYSPEADMFGMIFVYNHPLSAEGIHAVRGWTSEILESLHQHGGTYYLPYAPYATREQFRRTYPRADEFVAKKSEYDPNKVFRNMFFDNYLAG